MSDESTSEDQQDQQKEVEGAQYTPPATQADLDRIITDRISRERAKFADYDDLKTAAERLNEIEEANKTEAEKQAELIAELQSKVTDYEAREQVAKWKKEVSTETEVPADLLAGSTLEELQAHAERLKPHLAQPSNEPAPAVVSTVGNQPAPQGSVPLKDQIAAAEQAGDKALVARLKAIQLGRPD